MSEDDRLNMQVTADYVDPLIGRDFKGKYRIRSKLGEGGFGTVYRAIQLVVGREVALKVLRPDRAQHPEHRATLIKRFEREAIAMSKLSHPNTVQLIDFGSTEDDILFLVLELLSGFELSQVVATQAPLRPSRVAHILRQICLSLEEAHSQGIIHRDLKPANVFLCHVAGEDDHVKVMDFGIARVIEADESLGNLTKTGMTQGTPAYMAPEQAMALKTTPASDLYSLGCMAYEMLTGEMPFHGDSSIAISLAHLNDTPPYLQIPDASPSLSREWDKLFRLLVDKRQHARIQSASELAQRLKSLGQLSEPSPRSAADVDALDKTGIAAPALPAAAEQDDLQTMISTIPPRQALNDDTVLDQPSIAPPRSPLVIVGVAAALALALFVPWAMEGDSQEPTALPSSESRGSAASITEAALDAPPLSPQALPTVAEPQLTQLVLATQPSGALVYLGLGERQTLVCTTPCDVQVPATEEEESLTLRSQGFVDKVLKVHLSAGDQVVQALNLEAKRRAKAKRPRKSRAKRPRQALPSGLPRLRTGGPTGLPGFRPGASPQGP